MKTFYANANDVLRSDNRDTFIAWARSHGIDPGRTWSVRVIWPLVRIDEYEVDADGQKILRDGQIAHKTRWTWLRSWPPRVRNAS